MARTTRRQFLQTTAAAGVGFWVAGGTRQALSRSANERPNVACIGIGGKGSSDSNNAAQFGNVIAICDVDRNRLESKGKADGFKDAEQFTDFRELLAKHGKNIQIATISTPDHMHAPATLAAMRLGISCYTQKPLTRTIYEARLLAQVAKETGVCTQMGNQGTALDSSREAIAQLRSGVLGALKEVYAWSNRPIWAQGPGRRMTMEKFAAQAKKENPDDAERIIEGKKKEIERALERLDWKSWLGVAPPREFWPGLYHDFQWRGWWDFGAGALGDMACHQLTVPFASCGLRDPISVVAKSSGHDYDSFPASSIIKFEFPENVRTARHSVLVVRSPGQQAAARGVQQVGHRQGVRQRRDGRRRKGRLLQQRRLLRTVRIEGGREGHGRIREGREQGQQRPQQHVRVVPGMAAGDPKICQSNFVDRAGPLTETILLGNLAVWAAAKGGANGEMGDWGEKVEWDAKNLKVTNLASLKTPRVADLIKPKYPEGYRLD